MNSAVVFASYGPPDVLEVIDIAEPQPGPGQIRVRVTAAGVQPFDTCLRRGDFHRWVPVHFPQTLGNEFAGVIDKVGDGVRSFDIGREVIGFTDMDAYAELVVVGPDALIAKPAAMPWEEAGVLSAAGQTAHIALTQLHVGAGDTVLIHAAAGGVGTFAVQIARAWGATVIGTASERNHDYLRALGAIPPTYGPGLVDRVRMLAPHGVDAALDAIGGDAIPASLALVADKERIGTTTDHAGAARYGIRVLGGDRTAERLVELVRLYERGNLRVHFQHTYPLKEVAEAHRAVETGHVRGKVVLTLG